MREEPSKPPVPGPAQLRWTLCSLEDSEIDVEVGGLRLLWSKASSSTDTCPHPRTQTPGPIPLFCPLPSSPPAFIPLPLTLVPGPPISGASRGLQSSGKSPGMGCGNKRGVWRGVGGYRSGQTRFGVTGRAGHGGQTPGSSASSAGY